MVKTATVEVTRILLEKEELASLSIFVADSSSVALLAAPSLDPTGTAGDSKSLGGVAGVGFVPKVLPT